MRVLIAAGGTAGHVNPALAIAGEIKAHHPEAEITFAGRRGGMEYKLVGQAGYPFAHIEVQGIQRSLSPKNIVRNLKALYFLALALPSARKMMRTYRPDLVIGAGGYVSGPVVQAAARMGIPTVIHEQNAFPGVTNKILAPNVDLVFAAMPDAVQRLGTPEKTVVVGNPVRKELFLQNRSEAREKIGAKDGQIVVLSFGGSLGAQRVNEVVADLAVWEKSRDFLHIHATGSIEKADFAVLAQQKGIANSPQFVIREYIDDMPAMLAAADLVISRAGALTLAEIAAAGKAAIFIPSPHVAENHQYYNALQFSHIGAAIVFEEKELTSEKLIATVERLTQSNGAELMLMGAKASQLAQPNSLGMIYQNIAKLMHWA